MKFDQICKYVITESYKDKFIAITPEAESIVLPPEIAEFIARKAAVKAITPEFVEMLKRRLISDMPLADEIFRDKEDSLWDKDRVEEYITNITMSKLGQYYHQFEKKAKIIGLQVFRKFIQNGILEAIKYADTEKTDPEAEAEKAMKALDADEAEEWMSNDSTFGDYIGDVAKFTGGFGPTTDSWD